jgi:hypothetical protein
MVCPSCRDRLEFTDQYVAAMKAAGRSGGVEPANSGAVAVAGDAVYAEKDTRNES